ncbi:flavodoxin-like [Ylistrum balloti]|uniref:flavodoxin-like n=1 Tax=Ylistrum balloti TaxID=509963 RepID=UPI002905F4ED|nr:flavodoxin-like [Ylistrum balloti]
MRKGLVYASETGNTKTHAFDIVNLLTSKNFEIDDPIDIANIKINDLKEYDFLIFGSPTWNIGELQADLGELFEEFNELDFKGKIVAVYGCGDQEGYPDTYQDAIGILAEKLMERGALLIGKTLPEGHQFEKSLALQKGKFLGLSLDNDNQEDLTDERIKNWVDQIIDEFEKIKT